jgi:arylsulfatase
MPDKLKQLQALFYAEAKKYNALPLDNSTLARWNAARPNLTGGRTEFNYAGPLSGVPNSGAPNVIQKSYTITAALDIPAGGAEGVIVTDGGRFGGYALLLSRSYNYWLENEAIRTAGLALLVAGILLTLIGRSRKWSGGKRWIGHGMLVLGALWAVAVLATRTFDLGKGKPVFVYNLLDLKRTVWTGSALGAGKHTVVFDFKADSAELGAGGTGVLSVDGKEVARNTLEHTIPITFPEDETFDVGEDTRTGVALLEQRYDVPFKFTGKIDKLTVKLAPFTPEQKAAAEAAQMRANPDKKQ